MNILMNYRDNIVTLFIVTFSPKVTSTKWFVSGDCVYNSANNGTYDQQITALTIFGINTITKVSSQ